MSVSASEPSISLSIPITPVNNRLESDLRTENNRLRTQLQTVHGERLSALDNFQPCSDSDLRDAFVQLQHQISAFSRQLKGALGKSKSESTALDGQLLSRYPTDDIPIKFFSESFLWRQLYIECFQTPFILLGPESTIISQTWSMVFGQGFGLPKATEASEKWRSITAIEMFGKITPARRSERVKEITKSFLSRFLLSDYQLHTSIAKGDQLEKLIGKSWDAGALFAQQRCRLHLTVPETFENLNCDWVDVVQDVQHTERAVFAISPSLLKYGTGYGQNFESWLCIVKSKAIRVKDD
ncbi:hypothetical protein IFR05_010916 [Cadophora sp. M221]|nr:hypothetical protein IFR05_010916 [Cadophora sp. M221]